MNFILKTFKTFVYVLLPLICAVSTTSLVKAQCSSGCTYSVTASNSTNYDVTSGQKLCVNASSSDVTLSGSITTRPGSAIEFCSSGGNEVIFNSGWNFYDDGAERTVDIYGTLNRSGAAATFDRDTDVTIHSGGSLTTSGLMTNGSLVTITNDGDLNVNGAFSIQGASASFTNNGTTDITTGLTLNTGAAVINNSTMNTGGITINNGDFDNFGPLTASSSGFTLNSTSTFDNTSTADITGDVTLNSGDYSNAGTVQSTGRITINGGTNVDLRGGIFISDDLTINSGNFTVGTGNECSAFLVTDYTEVNSGVNIPMGSSLVVTDSSDVDTINQNNCGAGNCDLTFSAVNACYTTLPVELLRFWGKSAGDFALVHWLVGSETDNDFYTVERSIDGINFEKVAEVKGAGTTNELMRYTFKDREVVTRGTVYYRLKQTDFDGTTQKVVVMAVSFEGSHWEVFPNPSSGQSLHVSANGVAEEHVTYQVVNAFGEIVSTGGLATFDGSVSDEIFFPTTLPPNIYFLRLRLAEGTKNLRFVVY